MFVYGAFGCQFTVVSRFVDEYLDGTRAQSGLGVSMFFAAAVITRPVAGRWIDQVGRRWFIVVPPFVLAVVMLGFHFADSFGVVLALRFVQGAVGGGLYIALVAAVTDLAPSNRRASAIARLSIALYLGFAVGPAVGEWLLDLGPGVAWNVLAVMCAIGALCTVTLPETLPVPLRGPLGERRRSWLHPAAVLPGVAMLGLGLGYTSITALSALNARRIGLDDSTPLYLAFAGSVLLIRLGSGRLADRLGPVPVVNAGIVAFAAGFACIAAFDVPAPVIVGVALVGCGWALVLPAQSAWLASRVGDDERGSALGSLVAAMDIGQAIGGFVVGALADAYGFGWAYLLPCGLALLAFGVTQRVPRPPDLSGDPDDPMVVINAVP